MGQRAGWLGFVGKHDGSGRSSTIVFVDEVEPPDVATTWFVRTDPYAMICASPFFNEAVSVEPDASLRLAWNVVVADGAWDASAIESFIQSYGVDQRRTAGVRS
jgi:hypothetical protein